MGSAEFSQLDTVIHTPIRLAVVSVLAAVKSADFNYLKEAVGTTDGNLSVHLSKLEEAGYISIKKTFRKKKPLTTCSLNSKGRNAFENYVKQLEMYVRFEKR